MEKKTTEKEGEKKEEKIKGKPLIVDFKDDYIYFKLAQWKRKPRPYSFDEALKIIEKLPELPLTIGIVLQKGDDLTAIDLDSVLTSYGEIIGNPKLTPEEVNWIISTADSYTEISSSGFGLHILVKADYPRNEGSPFEMAGRDKYIVLTGNIWENRKEIKSNQKAIDDIHKRFFLKPNHFKELNHFHSENNQPQNTTTIEQKHYDVDFDYRSEKRFQTPTTKERDKKGPTTKHASIVVGPLVLNNFYDLFSLHFWEIFYSELFNVLYDKELPSIDLRKNLLSVMRQEDHPSFWLVENKHGEVVAFDFAVSNKPFRIQEVYHAFKTGKLIHLTNDELAEWTWRLMEDFNIWFKDAWDYKEKVDKFLASIEAPPSFMKVFTVVAEHLKTFARFNRQDILTARRLAELTGVNYKLTNKALNVLVACGLVVKTKPKDLPTGKTYLLKPVKDFDLSRALEIFKKITEYLKGRGGLKKFSRKTIQEIGMVEKIGEIFKAEKIEFKESGESETAFQSIKKEIPVGDTQPTGGGNHENGARIITSPGDSQGVGRLNSSFQGVEFGTQPAGDQREPVNRGITESHKKKAFYIDYFDLKVIIAQSGTESHKFLMDKDYRFIELFNNEGIGKWVIFLLTNEQFETIKTEFDFSKVGENAKRLFREIYDVDLDAWVETNELATVKR
ncbi:MAG TPA: hypothetical protein ENF81_08955 [Thermotogaceae bacterium]|nr:hypothetical protein [Thermotogaceae bacterium]